MIGTGILCGAVFFNDLEYLVPKPYSLIHVIDADIDEWGGNGFLRSGVLGKEPHSVCHLLALNPSGAAHGIPLQELW